MMMSFIVGAVLEVLVGVLMGFTLTNKNNQYSVSEMRVGTILFAVVIGIGYLFNPDLSQLVVLHLAAGWVILVVGVRLGEMLRVSLIKHMVTGNVDKRDVQLGILELVRLSQSAYFMNRADDLRKFQNQSEEVQAQIRNLIQWAEKLQQGIVADKLHDMLGLVVEYTSLTTNVTKGTEGLMPRLVLLGNDLLDLSWHALCSMEQTLTANVNNVLYVQALRFRG